MIEIDKVAESLFDKIRSRFDAVNIGDENAKATLDPASARFFNFDYIRNGKEFGNITISLVDDRNLKVYFDKELDRSMNSEEKTAWYKFLKSIRLFAKRHFLTFDVRDIAKSGLNIKDLKHANKNKDVLDKEDIRVTESKQYGTSRSSYELYDNVKIIARHSKPIVDETSPGARSRNIHAFYIENSLGERFRLPEGTTFNGARAYARHVKNNGVIHDDFGQHITKIIKEMSALKLFVRNMRGRTFEDIETAHMVESAIDHYGKLHRDLFTIRSQRGYDQYKSLWQPEVVDEDKFDIDELRERFVRKVFDDRLMDALPVVRRAYMQRKNAVSDEFESWANDIVENLEKNPINDENKNHASLHLDIEENNTEDVNVKSPFANGLDSADSDGNVMDGDAEDQRLEQLFQNNGFEFRFSNGVYYFESREELERAKDIIAAWDPNFEFPRMGIYDYGYGAYGSTTADREIGGYSRGVMEELETNFLKQLAGITK
jgi:hypothetical protein